MDTAQRVLTTPLGHLEAWLFLLFHEERIPRALSKPSQSRMTEAWLCEQHRGCRILLSGCTQSTDHQPGTGLLLLWHKPQGPNHSFPA